MRTLIERPIDTLLDFARGALNRVGSAVRGFIRSLIGLGQSGQLAPVTPAFVPAPAPVPIPAPPVPIPAPVPVPVPAPVPAPVPIVIIIIIVVIIIIVLIILLYLLYKWLKKRRRRKPKGKEYHPDTPFKVVNSLPARRVDFPAKPGETLGFTVESTDKDKVRPIGTAAWTPIDPGLGPYETLYEVSGNASWLAPGSGKIIHIDPKLDSRNISLFIDKDWNGDKITVTASVRDKAMPAASPDIGTTQDADHVITWTIVLCEEQLTTKTAKNIPSLAPQLNQTTYNSGSLTLLDGSSDTAARSMLTNYLTHEKTGGGPPAGQNNLYGFRKLPTKSAHGGSGYKQTQVFIKGHLLNEGLGGVGQAVNLFPITGQANKNHELGPEEDVKQLVRNDKLVVMYSQLRLFACHLQILQRCFGDEYTGL